MSDKDTNAFWLAGYDDNNNPIADLANKHSWGFLKELDERGFKFWSAQHLESVRKTFCMGFLTCSNVLKEKMKDALTNLDRREEPDDPYSSPTHIRVLTEKEIEEVIDKVFQ